jgi:uncharacterized protein (TIGR00730 family)
MKRICVFCGSNPDSRPEYRAPVEMGAELLRRNIELVYGGGNVGLMSIIADTVLEARGGCGNHSRKPHGAGSHKGLMKLHVVHSMHERKALMADLSDSFGWDGGFDGFPPRLHQNGSASATRT